MDCTVGTITTEMVEAKHLVQDCKDVRYGSSSWALGVLCHPDRHGPKCTQPNAVWLAHSSRGGQGLMQRLVDALGRARPLPSQSR